MHLKGVISHSTSNSISVSFFIYLYSVLIKQGQYSLVVYILDDSIFTPDLSCKSLGGSADLC